VANLLKLLIVICHRKELTQYCWLDEVALPAALP
jgi:hypothetical protein